MAKKYKHLLLLPHSDSGIAVPISGLFTELADRRLALSRISIITPESKLPIEQKHKDASGRISACLGYLSTISYRLTKPGDGLFMNLHLDWESLIIYSQIMLDSFTTLVPLFYGLSEEPFQKNRSPVFNDLSGWFNKHKIHDGLTKKYKSVKTEKAWYEVLNTDRHSFIHHLQTPHVVSVKAVTEAGFKMRKDKIFAMRDVKENWVKPETIEKETKMILKNVLDFFTFSDFFFKDKLKERNIFISDGTQFKCSLWGDFSQFNRLIF
ncbi:MAG: hypothetical protein Q7R77_00740 [Candidatus Daviesbacteria bacterium]|nr:hypothetical protein [Candidatus Daviesbacteria bacterium]